MASKLYGFCECGCGQKTKIATVNDRTHNRVKGRPYRFINGHNFKGKRGIEAANWKGGSIHRDRPIFKQSDHPRSNKRGYVFEHILIAEYVLGHYLDPKHVIHHVDEDKGNNEFSNLVICENHSYHHLLHKRTRALKTCGNANWRMCIYCKEYDNPNNLKFKGNGRSLHRKCRNKANREYRKNQRRFRKLLGKSLPKGTTIHHHEGNQLVICQDRAYHDLLHKRINARRKNK